MRRVDALRTRSLPAVEFRHYQWSLLFEQSHEMLEYALPHAKFKLVHEVGRE